MAGLSSFGGGSGFSSSIAPSATSTSGPATGGPLGLNISGINTGYSSGSLGNAQASGASSVPAYVWIGLIGILGLVALRMLR